MTGQSRPVNQRTSKWLDGLGGFQPRALQKHLLHGAQLDRSTLRQEFEQLHQAWPWSGLARFGPTTPTRAEDTGNQSPKGACSACKGAAGPTEAPLGPESTQWIPRQIGRRYTPRGWFSH